jgi:hypothetical protein
MTITQATSPQADLAEMAAQYRSAVNPRALETLAHSLGLSVESLIALKIGWSAHHRAWSFPMTDAAGAVLGIRLRRANGFKFAVQGGHEGLFIPATIRNTDNGTLFICEGPTDTAAFLDMGFNPVIGRPSCNGGVKLLVDLVCDSPARRSNDHGGQRRRRPAWSPQPGIDPRRLFRISSRSSAPEKHQGCMCLVAGRRKKGRCGKKNHRVVRPPNDDDNEKSEVKYRGKRQGIEA